MSGNTRSNKKGTPSKEIPDAANNKIIELEEELARQENQKTESPTPATSMNQENLDHLGIRAYTTYDDPETYHNMGTASIITVTGMNINDHVYHRGEVDQAGGVREGADKVSISISISLSISISIYLYRYIYI